MSDRSQDHESLRKKKKKHSLKNLNSGLKVKNWTVSSPSTEV